MRMGQQGWMGMKTLGQRDEDKMARTKDSNTGEEHNGGGDQRCMRAQRRNAGRAKGQAVFNERFILAERDKRGQSSSGQELKVLLGALLEVKTSQ